MSEPALEPGRLVRAAHSVQRLLAPNPSLMTGPGTNTYLLGDPPSAVLDPGPDDPVHLTRIEQAAPQLELILVTHTHADHAAGAMALAARTGARLVGRVAPRDGRQVSGFQPQLEPERDARIELPCGTVRAIDTPGHASNHVCYLLESEGLLFSGDHILDGVTPVIIPPDGSMAEYVEALRRLKGYTLGAIAPGHGRLLAEPYALIDAIILHREWREAKVWRALEAGASVSLNELLPVVYDDVRRELHGLARLSLTAHLIKLEEEGCCRHEGDRWYRTTSKRS